MYIPDIIFKFIIFYTQIKFLINLGSIFWGTYDPIIYNSSTTQISLSGVPFHLNISIQLFQIPIIQWTQI